MSNQINRRDLIKIGAGAAMAAQAAIASTEAPKFFTPTEFAMLDELTEMIIPTDDHSPGARAAQVASYIDARIAEAFETEEKEKWRNGLKLVDALSHKMHKHAFMEATPDERTAVLTSISKNERDPATPEERFFGHLKQSTAFAYYTSSIGIHQDIEYKGNVMLNEFVGYEVK